MASRGLPSDTRDGFFYPNLHTINGLSYTCSPFNTVLISSKKSFQKFLNTLRRGMSPNYVIVIPWVVRLYVKIIHEILRVDYLTYRRTTHGITIIMYVRDLGGGGGFLKRRNPMVSKEKNPSFVWGWDRKIRPLDQSICLYAD